MGRKRFGLDIDNTLLAQWALVKEVVGLVPGVNASLFDLRKSSYGLGEDGFDKVWEYLIRHELLAEMRIASEDLGVIQTWADRGDKISYITSRKVGDPLINFELFPSIKAQTEHCLKVVNKAPFADQIHFVTRSKDKYMTCQKLGTACMVDDNPTVIRALQESALPNGDRIRGYLIHQPYNPTHGWITRVRSLRDVDNLENSI